MPKLKTQKTPGRELAALIWGEIAVQKIPVDKACEYAQCSKPTLYKIKEEPLKHMPELLRLGRCLGVPIEQLRAALTYPW